MRTPPEGFDQLLPELLAIGETVDGYLSRRDIKLLALLAACPTAQGEILEIGTFQGKSTIVLSKAAALAGGGTVVAVDPLIDSALPGADAARHRLQANLERHGVAEGVEFHQAYSADIRRTWQRPIRLLWIDGDHSYAGAKSDFDLFAPCLADGAIVAMHDVLHAGEGPIRVFAEDILLARHFGPAGLSGSIGWAQFFKDPQAAASYRRHKVALYRRLSRLLPYVAFDEPPRGLARFAYKLLRWRVPHGDIDPSQWVRQVVFPHATRNGGDPG
jgi:hypothetical protein